MPESNPRMITIQNQIAKAASEQEIESWYKVLEHIIV